MNKKELVRRTASEMRQRELRKPVSLPKQVLHISDDEGNSKDFVVKKTDKTVIYTIEDVEAVIDTCLEVIEAAIRGGETVTVHGFGSLGLKYRKPRSLKHVATGERTVAEGRFVPHFLAGNNLKVDARIFETALEDGVISEPTPMKNDAGEGGDWECR